MADSRDASLGGLAADTQGKCSATQAMHEDMNTPFLSNVKTSQLRPEYPSVAISCNPGPQCPPQR